MKSILPILGIAAATLLSIAPLQAQPVNDNFSSATELSGPVARVTGSNAGASKEWFSREPSHAGNFGGASVWWFWTATASGPATIDTEGSDFNTLLAVYTGSSLNSLATVASNDDYEGNSWSKVEFSAVAGTVYRIALDGYRPGGFQNPAATGDFVLNLLGPGGATIESPTNGMTYIVGDPIPVTVSISTNFLNPPATQVNFFIGDTQFGSDTSEPFSAEAVATVPGFNGLYIAALDSAGLWWTSAVVRVLILNEGVTLIAPDDGATYANLNPITVSAIGLLRSGAITNIEFFVDGEKFAESASANTSVVWDTVASGSHRLTALGHSDTGAVYGSQPVWIGVAATLIPYGAVWNYLDDGSDQGTAWYATDFDDSGWTNGPAELGYGDGDEATVVEDNATPGYNEQDSDRYITTYFRQSFALSNMASYASLSLSVERDDGAVVYLNGREIFRSDNLPEIPTEITYMTVASGMGTEDTVDTISLNADDFVEGLNVFAVEIHQQSADSSDISFNLRLIGMPEIIRNQLPPVHFTHLVNNTFYFAPTQLILDIEAYDPDGSVTNLEIFSGSSLLAQSTVSPLPLQMDDVIPGIYRFTAVATDNEGARNASTVLITVYEPRQSWAAYNDHYAGPNTHPNATAWNAFGTADGAPGEEGNLRDIATGQQLPSYLSVFALGAMGDSIFGMPPTGTPADALFNGFVDFGSGGANHAIVLGRDSAVLHYFSGLDPNRRYNFRATAVGGVPDQKNRWTLFSLLGAQDFAPAHTANVLTTDTSPGAIYPDEAAMNTGDNTSGDVVGWNDITPGADGVFTVISTLYGGPAPGNNPPGPYAYAPVAVWLEEIGTAPFVELTKPTDYIYSGFTDLELAANASAVSGITNVSFLSNNQVIGSDATPPYGLVWSNAAFGYNDLVAIAYDSQGAAATSVVVSILISPPPDNTNAPVVVAVDPPAGTALTNLNSIAVTFSETVYGVNASDLLINGKPALEVSGSGSNYVFLAAQPAYGNVRITWTALHGIIDKGYPTSLPFDHNGAGARWNYLLEDRVSPTLIAQDPAAGSSKNEFSQLSVVFSEPVMGVEATDLIVGSATAASVFGSGTTYTFTFPPRPYGMTIVRWASTHGITDKATPPNAFKPSPSTWFQSVNASTELTTTNGDWRVRKGIAEASALTSQWRQNGFNDSTWDYWAAPVFYGSPYDYLDNPGTLLSDMQGNYSSVFLRKTFNLTQAIGLTNLSLRAQSDDGFVAWINGVEVCRNNVMSGEVLYDSTALSEVSESGAAGVLPVTLTLPNPQGYLREGLNVLAVQAFNSHLTNDDFSFDAQLLSIRYNSSLVGPGIIQVLPSAGYLYNLTDITVRFSEPVTGVDAEDLLLNAQPATSVDGGASNSVYTFSFPARDYGAVAVTWSANHGIADFDSTPRTFNASGAGSTWEYVILNPDAPNISSQSPPAGYTISSLSEIQVAFNEPVIGVDAGDLLVNGIPATAVTGSEANYTFSVVELPYGAVQVGWAANHGITDTESPPVPFEPASPGGTWKYTLIDQAPPTVVSQHPPIGSIVSDFTSVSVTFSEPVQSIRVSDLLINGSPATNMSGSNAVYTFDFPQPNASFVVVSFAMTHGIRDLALPSNRFDENAASSTWSYVARESILPDVIAVNPPPETTVGSLAQISILFNEPVVGVNPEDLLINELPAEEVDGSAAGPYTFRFAQPPVGLVQVAWAAEHGIQDAAEPPNSFLGGNWVYLLDTNLPPPEIIRGPYLQLQTPTSIIVRWRTIEATDSRVEYGIDTENRTNHVDLPEWTTEHIVTLTNLTPDTRFVYAVGATDTRLFMDTNCFFFTAPPVGTVRPTRIWYVSDFGMRNADERSVRDSYFAHVATEKPADVWITGGDNDQQSGTEAGYDETVFGTNYAYGALLKNLAVFPTIGNHDYATGQGVNYYANFSLPTQGEAGGMSTGTERYYSFNYANIHFINLNGIEGHLSVSTNTTMIEWLREDLAVNAQPWVIAYWHGPPYTKGSHDSDSTSDTLAWMVQMRENVLPVLEAHGVDLVLSGHSHVHERTWLINGHYGFSSAFNETNKIDGGDGKADGDGAYHQTIDGVGTVYISNGVGGQPRTTTNQQHPAHLLKITGILGSLVIDVDGNQLECKYMNTSGGIEDYFTLVKGDGNPPQIIISRSNGMTTVSWPLSAEGYQLQHVEALADPEGWQTITNDILTNGGVKMFEFDPGASAPAGWFRLEKR